MDVLCKRTEFHASLFQVVEHGYQVAQAAALAVELPHDDRVAVFEFLQTAEQGRAAASARRLIMWSTSNRDIALSPSRSPLPMVRKGGPFLSREMPTTPYCDRTLQSIVTPVPATQKSRHASTHTYSGILYCDGTARF